MKDERPILTDGWKLWLFVWTILILPGVLLGFLWAGGAPEPPLTTLGFGLWVLIWYAFLSPIWLIFKVIARKFR